MDCIICNYLQSQFRQVTLLDGDSVTLSVASQKCTQGPLWGWGGFDEAFGLNDHDTTQQQQQQGKKGYIVW